ncbi:hypothetical protein V6N13_095363 [Hibiscus sabdariffa]
MDKIAVVPPPRGDASSDKPVWRWESNHKFTTRLAYLFLSRDVTPLNAGIWTRVWKIPVPQRVRVFVWLLLAPEEGYMGDILARCNQLVEERKLATAAVQHGSHRHVAQGRWEAPLLDVANVIEEELLVLHSNVSEAVGIG